LVVWGGEWVQVRIRRAAPTGNKGIKSASSVLAPVCQKIKKYGNTSQEVGAFLRNKGNSDNPFTFFFSFSSTSRGLCTPSG